MKIIKQKTKTRQYKCPECGSIIEIKDNEFNTIKDFKPFPHLMGLEDFKKDTRIKIRVCDCPVCGGTIRKEQNAYRGEQQ